MASDETWLHSLRSGFRARITDAQAALVDRVVEIVAALENGNAYAYGIARGSFDEYASLPVASTQFLRR
jgi:hypothetical protein